MRMSYRDKAPGLLFGDNPLEPLYHIFAWPMSSQYEAFQREFQADCIGCDFPTSLYVHHGP